MQRQFTEELVIKETAVLFLNSVLQADLQGCRVKELTDYALQTINATTEKIGS